MPGNCRDDLRKVRLWDDGRERSRHLFCRIQVRRLSGLFGILAESLVEEWLNRDGYFTIRGVKHGLGEMDLLAVRPQPDCVVGWHVEVTVSFRPIGYIAREPVGDSRGRRGSYVRKRTPEQVESFAHNWVEAKFRA